MCGHVGIAGDLDHKDEAVLRRLLVFDVFRGAHSTGFAAVRKTDDVKIAKVASHPLDLFDMKKFSDALSGYNSKVFIGHNRYATQGAINTTNAHPWTFDHITGCHNGTLSKPSFKALQEKLGEDFEVDSMAIIASIAKFGIEETAPLLQGAWALVWFDTSDNTLNFLRNSERPFWFAFDKQLKRIIWASEYWTIQAAVMGADNGKPPYDFYTQGEKNSKYFQAQEDWWYRLPMTDLIAGSTERPKMKAKVLKGKEPEPVTSYTCGRPDPFHRTGTNSTTNGSQGGHSSSVIRLPSNPRRNVLEVPVETTSPYSKFLTKKEFQEIAAYGCSWCGTDIDYFDVGISVYPDRYEILCADCSGNETRNRLYLPNLQSIIS